MSSEVVAAREKFVDDLEKTLQLYDQADSKLAALQTTLTSVDAKLDEAYQTLDKRLTQAKVASTASSATSIIGAILIFTPLSPLGIGLTAAGAAASVATSLVQTLVFEGNAAKGIEEALNGYNSSSRALHDHLDEIEKDKVILAESLANLLSMLKKPDASPSIPKGPKGDPPDVPKPGPGSNHFTLTVLKGLANAAAAGKPLVTVGEKTATIAAEALTKALGEKLGTMLLGRLPTLVKGLPVLSIFLDVGSIISTWTSTNETLQQIDKLRKDLQANMTLFREAVKHLLEAMEGLVGSKALQVTLRKLIRLRAATPRRPGGPPGGIDPNQACNVLGLLKQMPDIPMLIFVGLQNPVDSTDDSPHPDKYLVELMVKADVLQLGELPLCAPVIDSVYDKYPEPSRRKKDSGEDQKDKDKPLAGALSMIQAFRDECLWTYFGNQDCYNVSGSQDDKPPSGTWISFWRWFFRNIGGGGCHDPDCQIRTPSFHKDTLRGGHMEKKYPGPWQWMYWYILPICGHHNAPSGTYDRGGICMTTKAGAWAVRIEPIDF